MESEYAFIQIILFVLRIVITVYCVGKAKDLNRSQLGWGVFAFILPILALIWIQFMKPRMQWESE